MRYSHNSISIKRFVRSITFLFLFIAFCPSLYGGNDSLKVISNINVREEVFISTKNEITSDFRVFKSFSPKLSTFFRYRTSIDIDDNVNDFLLIDFCYNIFPKVDFVFELQAGSGFGTIPRVGAQYFNTFGNFNSYLLYSYGPKDNTIEMEHIFSYGIPLSTKTQLKPQLELILNFKDAGYNFTIARSRLGLQMSRFYFGLGYDIFDSPSTYSQNYGLFFQIEF
jgi:hypothetical protein